MAWRIVRQPDGRLARWSDIVDNFTECNMSDAQALALCEMSMGKAEAADKVRRGLEDHEPWKDNVRGDGLARWRDCLSTILAIHGKDGLHETLTRMGFFERLSP